MLGAHEFQELFLPLGLDLQATQKNSQLISRMSLCNLPHGTHKMCRRKHQRRIDARATKMRLTRTIDAVHAFQIFQWRNDEGCMKGLPGWKPEDRKHVGEEMSDVLVSAGVIRNALVCTVCGVDLIICCVSSERAYWQLHLISVEAFYRSVLLYHRHLKLCAGSCTSLD